MADDGPAGMFMAQLDALQAFQQTLLGTLEDLASEVASGISGVIDGLGSVGAASAGPPSMPSTPTLTTAAANHGFGSFAEAQTLDAAYQSTVAGLVKEFQKVTKLAGDLIDTLGDSAKKYAETESEITGQFNRILQQIGL